MKDILKKYMSEELISKYLNNYYYIEKDNKLYCTTPHKEIDLYNINNSSYNVETFTNDEIIAKGIVTTRGPGTENKANVNIVINKNNDNWQITKYDIQELK